MITVSPVHDAVGEVRIKVKLTNAVAATLAAASTLSPENVRVLETEGLVDTRAVRSVLPAYDRQIAQYANRQKEEVDLVDGVRFEIMNRRSSEEALLFGDEVFRGAQSWFYTCRFPARQGERK